MVVSFLDDKIQKLYFNENTASQHSYPLLDDKGLSRPESRL